MVLVLATRKLQLPATSQIEDVTDPEMDKRSVALAANRPLGCPLSSTFPLTTFPSHINHNVLLEDHKLSTVQLSLVSAGNWLRL